VPHEMRYGELGGGGEGEEMYIRGFPFVPRRTARARTLIKGGEEGSFP